MAERIITILTPQAQADAVMTFLKRDGARVWQAEKDGGQSVISVLSEQEDTEHITDALQRKFGHIEGLHLIVQAVEASISKKDNAASPEPVPKKPHDAKPRRMRIGREELYADIQDGTRLSHVFMVMTVLSTVVAAIGLLRNNVPVIIGAMVIAPLLGPNVALALAATLADVKLGWQAAKAFVAAALVAFALSVVSGLLLAVDPATPEIAGRTTVGLADIVLSLAAGCAGVLAYTTGASGAVIGVMVAVALLPPLVVAGLLLGKGHGTLATGAFLLFACNVICVNVAGIVTFLVQGVRPRSWWEANRAKRASRKALAIWLLLLALLCVVLLLVSE
jgi:uncharacterized hydrophobic protein (TIGR00341 family)